MPDTPALRIAGTSDRRLPKKVNFTAAILTALKAPVNGRTTIYDAKVPGLAYTVTSNDARSFYFIRWYKGRGQRLRLGGAETTIEQARKLAAQYNGQIADGKDPGAERRAARIAESLQALWDRYKSEWLEPQGSERTKATEESRFKTCLGSIASRRISDITENDVRSLHAKVGKAHGQVSANRAIQLLRRLYNFARITPNPAARSVTMFTETSRTRFLTPAEMQTFLAALDDKEINQEIADAIRLSLFTGARRANVTAARA